MKLKKFLAGIVVASTVATTCSGIAMATNSYGSPELTASVSYPVDMYGMTVMEVIVGYKGFSGFTEYNSNPFTGTLTGIGLTSAEAELTYDTEALTFVATLKGDDYSTGIPSNKKPALAWFAADDSALSTKQSATSFAKMYFKVKEGVDFSKQSIEFGFTNTFFGVTNVSTSKIEYYGDKDPSVCTDVVKATPVTYGSATKTYTVTLGEGATTTYEGVLTAVPENTEITVTATEKSGYTATLKKDGVEVTSPYTFAVTANTEFTVDYTAIVPANPHKYTLDDKGTCMKDTVKGIYYSLSVKNVADKLAIKVSDKVFEATGIPELTGDPVTKLTYVILGVPEDIYNAVPALGGVTSGETVFDAE